MQLEGIFVPLVTPFDDTGAVALGALERLADDVLDAGAHGLVGLGTTGEPGSLTPAEQKDIAGLLRGICSDRGVPLVLGAHQAGLDEYALVTVPAFVRPGENGVVAYFEELAPRSGPIVVYNVPYRTGQRLSGDALRRLAAIENVVGFKHSVGRIDDATVTFLGEVPDGFSVLGGDDAVISPLLALGAHGGILASAHLRTAAFVELFDAWQAGDAAHARRLGPRLARISAGLFAEPNPTVVKAVLHAQGRIPTSRVRLPLLAASQYTTEEVLRML